MILVHIHAVPMDLKLLLNNLQMYSPSFRYLFQVHIVPQIKIFVAILSAFLFGMLVGENQHPHHIETYKFFYHYPAFLHIESYVPHYKEQHPFLKRMTATSLSRFADGRYLAKVCPWQG